MGLERGMTNIPIVDRLIPRRRSDEIARVSEQDIRVKLYDELEANLTQLAGKSANEQDSITTGYALPGFKVGNRNYSVYMVRDENESFVVSDLKWIDDPNSPDEPTPTNKIDFSSDNPSYFVQKPKLSMEDKYRKVALLPPLISQGLTDPEPANLPISDLQRVVNDVRQVRIEQQVANTHQIPQEILRAA